MDENTKFQDGFFNSRFFVDLFRRANFECSLLLIPPFSTGRKDVKRDPQKIAHRFFRRAQQTYSGPADRVRRAYSVVQYCRVLDSTPSLSNVNRAEKSGGLFKRHRICRSLSR